MLPLNIIITARTRVIFARTHSRSRSKTKTKTIGSNRVHFSSTRTFFLSNACRWHFASNIPKTSVKSDAAFPLQRPEDSQLHLEEKGCFGPSLAVRQWGRILALLCTQTSTLYANYPNIQCGPLALHLRLALFFARRQFFFSTFSQRVHPYSALRCEKSGLPLPLPPDGPKSPSRCTGC